MTSLWKLAAALAVGTAIALSAPALAADESEKVENPDMSLGEAAEQAGNDAEKLGDKAGDAAEDTANAAERGYEWTKDKAVKAYDWSKKQVEEATR